MRLFAVEIPDDPDQLPRWLEQHLLGPHLNELVAELAAVHPDSAARRAPLDEVLGQYRDAVLTDGLRALSPKRLQALLQYPRLLLDLQELVFTEGGPYWDEVTPSEPLDGMIDRGRRHLEAFLNAQQPFRAEPVAIAAVRPAAAAAVAVAAPTPSRGGRWLAGLTALATAAAVFIAVYIMGPGRVPVTVAWGWNKPDVLTAEVSAPQYLRRLADAAQEWSAERPETREALSKRLDELRQGCQRLIDAPHPPLAAADRSWLEDRCRKWKEKFDEQAAMLAKGDDPVQVRTQTDETVTKLMSALRDKANEVAART